MSEVFAIVIMFQLVLFMYYYPVKIDGMQPTKGQGLYIEIKHEILVRRALSVISLNLLIRRLSEPRP
jgi:hypothetical protein